MVPDNVVHATWIVSIMLATQFSMCDQEMFKSTDREMVEILIL